MVNSNVMANAVTTVAVAAYVICRLLASIVPNFLFAVGNSWFHTITLDAAKTETSLTVGMFILGLVSLAVVAWLFTWAVAELYNRWEK